MYIASKLLIILAHPRSLSLCLSLSLYIYNDMPQIIEPQMKKANKNRELKYQKHSENMYLVSWDAGHSKKSTFSSDFLVSNHCFFVVAFFPHLSTFSHFWKMDLSHFLRIWIFFIKSWMSNEIDILRPVVIRIVG